MIKKKLFLIVSFLLFITFLFSNNPSLSFCQSILTINKNTTTININGRILNKTTASYINIYYNNSVELQAKINSDGSFNFKLPNTIKKITIYLYEKNFGYKREIKISSNKTLNIRFRKDERLFIFEIPPF